MNVFYSIPLFLIKFGSYSNKDATSFATSLMDIIKGCGVAVGGVIIAWASIKLIMALAEENVGERSRAGLMMGVGIFFVSITSVLTDLLGANGAITKNTSANEVAASAIGLLGKIASYAGGAMVIFGIFTMIMALSQEDASQQAKSTTSMLVAIGLLSVSTVLDTIKSKVAGGSTDAGGYVSAIIKFIGKLGTYAGACIAILGIFRLIVSIKEEDGKSRNDAIKLLIVAIALLSFPKVLAMMGLS